jgi:DNA polymerase-3 subunit epsilon
VSYSLVEKYQMDPRDLSPEAQLAIVAKFTRQQEGSRKRSREHRQRLVDAGYVRVQGWVPQQRREATLDYIAAQGKPGASDGPGFVPYSRSLALSGDQPSIDADLTGAGQEERIGDELRPLTMRQIVPRSPKADEKVALIVDVVDARFDPEAGRIGDLGIVAVTYQDGRIGEVIGSIGIQYTGSLCSGAVPSMLSPVINQAAIVIAHHAQVIRPLCERLTEGFASKPWACTATEIPWASFECGSIDLGYLLRWAGWAPAGSRAVENCFGILELLASPLAGLDQPNLSTLLAAARRKQVRIWIDNVQPEDFEILGSRGYRAGERQENAAHWWIDVPLGDEEAEIAFLRDRIYPRTVEPRREKITAQNRFRPPN